MLEAILTQTTFFAILALFALGAIAALIFRKDDKLANLAGSSFAILGSLLGIAYSIAAINSEVVIFYEIKSSFPLLSFNFNIDKLSAFFIFIISLISLFCSIYGTGYIKHFYGKYSLGSLGFFYNFFIAGMLLVVSSANILFFPDCLGNNVFGILFSGYLRTGQAGKHKSRIALFHNDAYRHRFYNFSAFIVV